MIKTPQCGSGRLTISPMQLILGVLAIQPPPHNPTTFPYFPLPSCPLPTPSSHPPTSPPFPSSFSPCQPEARGLDPQTTSWCEDPWRRQPGCPLLGGDSNGGGWGPFPWSRYLGSVHGLALLAVAPPSLTC